MQTPLLIILAGAVLLDSRNTGPQIHFDRDFQNRSQKASAYLSSMWLPALPRFSSTFRDKHVVRDREVDRLTGRQTDRQADRQTDRQADRQTDTEHFKAALSSSFLTGLDMLSVEGLCIQNGCG
ncbi:unnamed protein product [Pleuronectes platessa]|uniref:Uncharacterized protein n=1 Tax=Pleuronectes platessa TaxID=8262 RepID=A0A9N7U5X9_PLEPL|nr:unnamed protein product [Pleuronectes platessa]